jgi:hypothetical protein
MTVFSADPGTSFSNPFAGLVPDFSVFGADFTTWWQKLFGGMWALCILAAAGYLLISLVRLHKATNNNIPGQADEAKTAAAWAGGSLAALCGFAVIVGALFALAN